MQKLLIRRSIVKSILCIILVFFAGKLFAAGHQSDNEIIAAKLNTDSKAGEIRVSFMQVDHERWIVRNNPVVLTFGGLMYVYQRFISPQLPSECLYHTSCSAFSKSLIGEYGLIKGMVATADRLMRCNRVAALDIHPLKIHQESGKVMEETDIYRKENK